FDAPSAELEWLRVALDRLARHDTTPAHRAAALATAQAATTTLDQTLVTPLEPVLGDAPLVIVPTGVLHALPWGALPSLRGRSLVVAPSLSMWLGLAARAPVHRTKHTLVAGPRLRHAEAEIRDLATLLPGTIVLRGKEATAAATLAALDGAA